MSTEAAPGRTLVLCRTGASANAVRRFIAGRGGALGIEIVTPSGLAASLEPNRLLPEEHEDAVFAVPQGHPWETVNDRPGLRAVLAGHLADILVEGLEEKDIPEECRDKIAPLLKIDGSATRDVESMRRLLTLATTGKPGKPLGYDRVFAVGFGDNSTDLPQPPGTNRYFDRLLKALDACIVTAPKISTPEQIETVLTADVASEAAWAVDETSRFCNAGGKAEDVLILYSSSEDRDRIAAALARNGIPAAVDKSHRLSRHALAVLIQSILPWFSNEPADKVTLKGKTLRKLFQSQFIGQARYSETEAIELRRRLDQMKVTQGPLENTVDTGETAEDNLSVSRQKVPDTLLACHRINATIPEWINSLNTVANDNAQNFKIRRNALLLWQRLCWLRDQRGATLGHLRNFLNILTLRTFGDRVALAIQGALADAKSRPANPDTLDEVLDGAVSTEDFHVGATLLAYGHYDGRPSSLCLLTGMHSKGVGQAPGPDPFFIDSVISAWGRKGGSDHFHFLIKQASAAVARARTARACVAMRSSDGRAVVGVSHKLLKIPGDVPRNNLTNYGLMLGTPENENRTALKVISHPAPIESPFVATASTVQHAAMMATVEWIRNGGAFERNDQPTDEQPMLTLRDTISQYWDAIPKYLRPYLGDGSGYPAAALPRDAVLSVSRGFNPLSHCLFQAYLKTRMRLDKAEELEEELSAAEVGSAVHKALEEIGIDPRWRPKKEGLNEAVAGLQEALIERAGVCLEAQIGKNAPATEALKLARDAHVKRWNQHLNQYVVARAQTIESIHLESLGKVWKQCAGTPELLAFTALLETLVTVDSHKKAALNWLRDASAVAWSGKDPFDDALVDGIEKANPREGVRVFIQNPDVQQAVRDFIKRYASIMDRVATINGAIVGGKTEWKFGSHAGDESNPKLLVQLGEARDVAVIGSVDRIRVLEGPGGAKAVEIVDYKTGKSIDTSQLKTGTLPQLPVYAIALNAAAETGCAIEGMPKNPVATSIGYDLIRKADPSGSAIWEPGVNTPSLEDTGELLGWLVELARKGEYPVIPHSMTCPATAYHDDYCPFLSVCRFHTYPGAEEAADISGTEEKTK